jgi:diguanylate cyclase (GGDEF)-like protein
MSFRLKIVLSVFLIQIVVLMFLVWNGVAILRSTNENSLLERSITATRLFATAAQSSVITLDLATLESLVEEVLANPGVVYARVRTAKAVLAEQGNPEAKARPFLADSDLLSAASDGVFDAFADITVAGTLYGRVELGFSTSEIERIINDARNDSLSYAILNIVLVGVFSLFLGVYLTRQLKELRLGAERVAGGELGYQITIRGRDELAETANAFNDMSRKLQAMDAERDKRTREVHQLNSELEFRVNERTQQLQKLNKQLEHQALYDALTNVPNRVLFMDRLRSVLLHARRSNEAFALVGVDLDDFKDINDGQGHQAGDLVLQFVAHTISSVLRDSDTLARMGGDEFYILLPRVSDVQSATKVITRVIEILQRPYFVADKPVAVSASFGIAMYPQHGSDETELMSHSDVAMYEAKRKKLGIVVYSPQLEENKSEMLALRSELSKAITNGQLVLHYQPKIDLMTKTVIGLEALVRWSHPRLGLLFPDKFILLAETSGQINALTTEVIRIVLRQLKEWKAIGIQLPVAVNISATNLQDEGFVDWLGKNLHEYSVEAKYLELEVTETAIMTEPLLAIENVRRLATMGVQVAIDDFGTGYSSMAYLQKLLVAKIKIDKTFVMNMDDKVNDEVIVRSTIDLAHNLGLKAIAEGVESEAVWDRLKSMGCDAAQGYFMSKPLSPDKIVDWMKSNNSTS